MEILKPNETVLQGGCFDVDIKNGCEDDIILGGNSSTKSGVYKAFNDIILDQLNVDPYSCFVVGPYTALCNITKKKVDYDTIRATLERLQKDGKFTPGFGGKLSDGVQYVTEDFNAKYGTNFKYTSFFLNADNIIEAISSGSPISTGIKYGSEYFKNEQSDGIIQNINGTIGNHGHCVTICKINTTDTNIGAQVKFVENYADHLKYNIIYAQFDKMRDLFFNSGFKFTI